MNYLEVIKILSKMETNIKYMKRRTISLRKEDTEN